MICCIMRGFGGIFREAVLLLNIIDMISGVEQGWVGDDLDFMKIIVIEI